MYVLRVFHSRRWKHDIYLVFSTQTHFLLPMYRWNFYSVFLCFMCAQLKLSTFSDFVQFLSLLIYIGFFRFMAFSLLLLPLNDGKLSGERDECVYRLATRLIFKVTLFWGFLEIVISSKNLISLCIDCKFLNFLPIQVDRVCCLGKYHRPLCLLVRLFSYKIPLFLVRIINSSLA